VLAVAARKRLEPLPDVPTMSEAGYPAFETGSWQGVFVPAGTPKDIVERLNAEVARALHDPDLIAKFAQQGLSPAGGSAADFARAISTDIKNWTEIARAANIKAD